MPTRSGVASVTFIKRFKARFARRSVASALLFLVIPIVFLIAVFELTKAKGPQWLPDTFENPYAYLFNSLLLVKGQEPVHIDHPGTTTQVFGAIVLRASSMESADELVTSTLRNPEKQIRKLHQSLLFFTAFVIWFAPWITAVISRNILIGLLIQAPILFNQTLLYYGILFGSDLMLVPFSIAAICCSTLLIRPKPVAESHNLSFDNCKRSPTHSSTLLAWVPPLPALTGLVCALGIVTKLTFFPLVLISLLCCRRWRNLRTFIAAFAIGLAVSLLPIHSQLLRLLTWAFSVGTHSGEYGTGAVGFAQSEVYFPFLGEFLQKEPLVAIIPLASTFLVILLSLLSKKKRSTNSVSWRTALPLFAIQLISFFVIAKESGPHYFIPLALTAGLSLVLLFYALQTPNSPAIVRAIGWVALTALLALGFKDFLQKTPATYANFCDQRVDLLRLYKHAKKITKEGVRVDYLFSDSPEYAMCYGNSFAGHFFGAMLSPMFPNSLFFNVVNGQFETFTGYLAPEAVLSKYDHLYFLGTPSLFPKVDGLDPGTFEMIDQAGEYYLQKWTRK
jgi:hypothetical protein